MTLAPAQPSSPNSKIGEVISIIDHTQIEVPVVESNEPPKLFKVGSQSGSCYKTITGTEGFVCPLTLTKDNWSMEGLRHATCNDKFEVTQEANSLTVKRVDSRGRDCHGWGMQLQFHCVKAVVEQAPTTSSSSSKSLPEHLEVGQFHPANKNGVDHKKTTHAFQHNYKTEPVVIAGVVSMNGGHPVVPQVVNVSKDAVTMRLDEPSCYDDWHLPESADWLAIGKGLHKTDQGVAFEVGTQELKGGDWQDVKFTHALASSPVVVPSINGQPAQWANLRIMSVSTSGFKIHLEAERPGQKYPADASVKISWIAIPEGTGSINDIKYEAKVTAAIITEKWTKFSFPQITNARIFAGVTHNGGHTATLRLKDQKDGSVMLRMDEPERCGFDEKHPYAESAHMLVIQDTNEPFVTPTDVPTAVPTTTPTESPTTLPPTTDKPSFSPTATPTEEPTAVPTATPTEDPTQVATTTSYQSKANRTQGSVTVSLPQIVKTALHIRQEKKACMDDWNYCASVGFLANASHKICKDSKGQWKGSCTMRDCSNMHYECQKAAEDLNILPREIQEKSVQEREDEFWANFDWDF
jgi:hypothetical protein